MRYIFGTMAAAVVIAALCGAAVAWDGPFLLFHVLDTQLLSVEWGRLINGPPQLAVIAASHFTSSWYLLRAIYTFAYGVIPLASLGLSWWVVRGGYQGMFVWAVFGIALGTLPNQVAFFTEAYEAVQLFWPVLLIVLTGIRGTHIPILVLLCLVLFVTHPTAIPLFALGAGTALLLAVQWRARRRRFCAAALGLLVACVAALSSLFLRNVSYEADRLTIGALALSFRNSLAGLPLFALICAWGAALAVLAEPHAKRTGGLGRQVVYWFELMNLLASVALLLLWSSNAYWWRSANQYRSWVLFCSLPFFILAIAEGVWGSPRELMLSPDTRLHRLRTAQVCATIFLLVLTTQSITIARLTEQLRVTLAQAATPCTEASAPSLAWVRRTPLNFWSLPAHSLLVQGREPQKVILPPGGCGMPVEGHELRITPFYSRPLPDGWFTLDTLAGQLEGQR